MSRKTLFITGMSILFALISNAHAQVTEKQRVEEATARITGLLNAGGTDSAEVAVTDVVDVDSSVGDVNTYFGQLQDPYGTLKGSFIFIAEETNVDPWRSEVGVFKDGRILWTSKPIIEGAEGRIYAALDLTNSGKVDIIATWLEGAGGDGEDMWIFSWDGEKGVPINPYDDTAGSYINGNRGSFMIEDINGDGKYEITCRVDTAAVEYAWDGTAFQTITNPPVLRDNKFSPANNFNMTVSAGADTASGGYKFNYTVSNSSSSEQSINNFMVAACLDGIREYAPSGWKCLTVKSAGLTRFAVEIGWDNIVMPGNTLNGFVIVSNCLPGISEYYAQAPHNVPSYEPQEYLAHQSDFINDFINNSVSGYTIGPVKLMSPFIPLDFIDTLISYKHQSFTLGWIDNQGIVNSLDSKLDNARKKLAAGDIKAAKNILNAFVNEVKAQKGKHLTSEAYALLKYNAEYLIDRLK